MPAYPRSVHFRTVACGQGQHVGKEIGAYPTYGNYNARPYKSTKCLWPYITRKRQGMSSGSASLKPANSRICTPNSAVSRHAQTLNHGFTLAHPIDLDPDSGRLVSRCHSAKALRSIPNFPIHAHITLNPPHPKNFL